MPSLGVNRFEILDELFIAKTRFFGRRRLRDPSLRRFDTVPACDGRTDGQTDRQQKDNLIVANTGLCIESYADPL